MPNIIPQQNQGSVLDLSKLDLTSLAPCAASFGAVTIDSPAAPTIEPPETKPDTKPETKPETEPNPSPAPSEPATKPFNPPDPDRAPQQVPDGDPCRTYPFCEATFSHSKQQRREAA